MNKELVHCDMCGIKIENGKCSCGKWFSSEEMKTHPYKNALEHFYDQKQMIITADAPHLGIAAVFFRGDYNDCLEISEFIKKIKQRPFYPENT